MDVKGCLESSRQMVTWVKDHERSQLHHSSQEIIIQGMLIKMAGSLHNGWCGWCFQQGAAATLCLNHQFRSSLS
jgi:hypothetical protein